MKFQITGDIKAVGGITFTDPIVKAFIGPEMTTMSIFLTLFNGIDAVERGAALPDLEDKDGNIVSEIKVSTSDMISSKEGEDVLYITIEHVRKLIEDLFSVSAKLI